MMTRFRYAGMVAAFLLASGSIAASSPSPDEVDFNRDIRPILSEKCFTCHGPDRRKRRARLRLDTEEGVFTDLGGYRAVVPGKLDESELYARIVEESAEDRMPPPEARQLATGEIDLLRRWIEQGARWASHWSFTSVPEETPLPPVERQDWARNPIDLFVLDRLEKERLAPAPPAMKERLLRRVTISLTGLPPTANEIDAFLADDSPAAYEKAVDRLLASAAYGERVAVDWLDVARFADTYGYQADRYNHLWPWRDWVIGSFNRDLPYDESVLWQLSGDLLPNATREQYLATAFNRNHRQTNEGGSVNEEFRVEYNADRVNTTATAFLGLTMECARCHEHKFDPISQEEYYQFFAFFNSTDESGLYSHFTDAIPCPTLLLYRSDEEEARHKDLKARIASGERELEAYRRRALAYLSAGRPASPGSSAGSPQEPGRAFEAGIRGLVGDYSFDDIEKGVVPNAVGGKPDGQLSESPRISEGRHGKALLFDGENSASFKGVADFGRTQPFSLSLWLNVPEERERIVVLHHSRAGSDAGSRGYELLLEGGRASFALIHFWPGNSIKVTTSGKLPLGEWIHVTVTYDGSSRAAGIGIYLNGRAADVEIRRDNLWKDVRYGSPVPLTLAARFRGPGFRGGRIDELKVFDRRLTPPEVSSVYQGRELDEVLAQEDVTGRHDLEVELFDEEYSKRLAELRKLRDEENDLVNGIPEIMVMGDLPAPRPTHVLRRGAYDAPGKVVEPGTPRNILPFDESLPRNRLGLATWMVDPRNPLTARVAVNRAWQRLFGRGLVSTPEDFGNQGALPSHPRLLDWLARWLMTEGWSLKALDRIIVLSATYRQSSIGTPEKLEKDPDNILLSRGPSRRLSAEEIRDVALFSAGLVRSSIGGPSIQPGKPIDGTVAKAREDGREEGPPPPRNTHRYRRSLYTYIKRTAPSPYLMTFDGNNRETCVVRRQTTNTPLQALVLLNDPVFNEASRMLGETIVREGGDTLQERVAFAFRRLTGRRPRDAEQDVLVALYREQRAQFRDEPERASAFLESGEYRRDAMLDAPEVAAAAILANAILSFDETLTLR